MRRLNECRLHATARRDPQVLRELTNKVTSMAVEISVEAPPPVLLDGATLTPAGVAAIAREGAEAVLDGDAAARNDRAREAIAALLARGDQLYGATTGVGRCAPTGCRRAGARATRCRCCAVTPAVRAVRCRSRSCARRWPRAPIRSARAAPESPPSCSRPSSGRSTRACRHSRASSARLGPETSRTWPTSRSRCSVRGDLARRRARRGVGGLADAGLEPARLAFRDGLAFMSSNAI